MSSSRKLKPHQQQELTNSSRASLDKKNIEKFDVIDQIYQYQSESKLNRLPRWLRIIIVVFLIVLVIGVIVGGTFAIMKVNDKNRENQKLIQNSLVINSKPIN
ncbi:hypothetical protein [Mycoplasma amphoriforme]|uniref:Uncharacterized protein n=1 Tax=Mycoplasma amphoriforme A39 TaxID=572419 RepID=A0A292II70_9MOLU|nr:unnamed protein product [Mycoplasma amphoriforme A39]